MTRFKQFQLNDLIIKYNVVSIPRCDGYVSYWTNFYIGTKVVKKYKFNFKKLRFELHLTEVPKFAFVITEDADDPNFSKEYWLEKINEKLKMLSRKKELASGELV